MKLMANPFSKVSLSYNVLLTNMTGFEIDKIIRKKVVASQEDTIQNHKPISLARGGERAAEPSPG